MPVTRVHALWRSKSRARSPSEFGLKITPHQFRHAAAAIVLKHHRGNYELVRQVLGHKNVQTTVRFYVGLDSIFATERFGELVLRHIGELVEADRNPQ